MCRFGCGTRIAFNDKILSKNGKKIPLNFSDNLPHDCPLRNQADWKSNLQGGDSISTNDINVSKEAITVSDSPLMHYPHADKLAENIEQSNKQYEMLLIDTNYIKKQLDEIARILVDLTGKSP
jgi:hypothetical protein